MLGIIIRVINYNLEAYWHMRFGPIRFTLFFLISLDASDHVVEIARTIFEKHPRALNHLNLPYFLIILCLLVGLK